MALELQISYCQQNGCKTLVFTDTTGTYDVTSNPTGWGAPNVPLDDVNQVVLNSTYLALTIPNGTQYTFDILDQFAVTYGVDTLEFPLINTDIGLSVDDTFADGIYTVVYNIKQLSTATNYNVTRRFFTLCYMQKRIDQLLLMFAKLMNCGSCDVKFMDELYQVFILFEALKSAVFCGAESNALSIYARLEKMVNLIDYDYVNM